jgi:membrane fusion protein (multidrug efflux system)
MIRALAPVLLLLVAGCSGGSGDSGQNPAPVALVTLATVQWGNVTQTVTLYGSVERGAEAQYTLAAPVEATLVAVPAPVGTAVARGQLVAQLRPTPTTRADLSTASSTAAAAAAALARAERLRKDGLASDADVESARSAATTARAHLQSLTRQTGGLDLRSPGPGHVETVAFNPGDIVSAGAVVATIARAGAGLRARFGADPATAGRLSPGTTLLVSPAGGGASFATSIVSVDPTVDPQTRLASVFARVPPRPDTGPGQALSAETSVAHSGSALTIPYQALLDDGGQPYVYVVANGVAHRHDVTTGPTSGERIAIIQGLSAGEQVVVQGGTAVEDGMKVRTK